MRHCIVWTQSKLYRILYRERDIVVLRFHPKKRHIINWNFSDYHRETQRLSLREKGRKGRGRQETDGKSEDGQEDHDDDEPEEEHDKFPEIEQLRLSYNEWPSTKKCVMGILRLSEGVMIIPSGEPIYISTLRIHQTAPSWLMRSSLWALLFFVTPHYFVTFANHNNRS